MEDLEVLKGLGLFWVSFFEIGTTMITRSARRAFKVHISTGIQSDDAIIPSMRSNREGRTIDLKTGHGDPSIDSLLILSMPTLRNGMRLCSLIGYHIGRDEEHGIPTGIEAVRIALRSYEIVADR